MIRFEHLRQIKQTGWTQPRLRTPEVGERWTRLIIAAHTRIRLLRRAAADLRRPWEKPAEPGGLTRPECAVGSENSARTSLVRPVHRNPQHPDQEAHCSKNRRPATRYDMGKTVKRPGSIIERNPLRH